MKRLRILPVLIPALTLGSYIIPAWAQSPTTSAERDLAHIAALRGTAQRNALISFFENFHFDSETLFALVRYEDRLRRPLTILLADKKYGEASAAVLTLLGHRESIPRLLSNTDTPPVLCGFLDVETEREWNLLQDAANGKFSSSEGDCAILALKLIASPRSLQLLKEALASADARNVHDSRKTDLKEAIEYIESKPPAMQHRDLASLITRVAKAFQFGEPLPLEPPQFNANRTIAMAEMDFGSGCRYEYLVTFHRVNGVWRMRGLRLMGIGLMPPPPPPPPPR
ncbi:MAG: hypothetical protein ABI972_10750 [Acidobacteriota bacterium]